MRFKKPKCDKAVILATGPSLTEDKIWWARQKQSEGWTVFGVNNVYHKMPEIDVHLACNIEWWDYYWPSASLIPAEKWTWDEGTAEKYRINHIPGKWAPSLSKDANFIHYGHASGYQILGLAYHYGMREMYLLGYDMAYPPGQPRHFFGEYPNKLQHWPRVGPKGEFTGLIEQFNTIDEEDLGIEVFNLCPTSALHHFQKGDISDY